LALLLLEALDRVLYTLDTPDVEDNGVAGLPTALMPPLPLVSGLWNMWGLWLLARERVK
jgi:hypothetical protein